jgi:hypothetical protein
MDTSAYNLYVSLKEPRKETFTLAQKDGVLKNISTLDEKGQEMVYMIIKYYFLEHENNKNTDAIPYEGKFVSKNLRFDLEKFPSKLKSMLHKFISMHLSLMEDEKNRMSIEKNL